MSSNTVYAILNWNRDYKPTLESLNLKEGTPLILCSNTAEPVEGDGILHIDPHANISKSKNKIIDFAKEKYPKAKYLFIIEDDVIVKDNSIFDKYIELMEKYELGVVFYGFDRTNTLFKKPNPGLAVTVSKEGEEVWFNRFPCTSVIGFDLEKNNVKFNENLMMIEIDVYMQECANAKLIPYNGFYFDIQDSFKYFERQDIPTERLKTREAIAMDKKVLMDSKFEIVIESNADGLMKLLREKNGYAT